jgi:hypothetical protein
MLNRLKLKLCFLVLVGAVVFVPASAGAVPLGLVLQTPDALVDSIDITYDAGTDAFAATGFALSIDSLNLDAPGSFSLFAVIDDLGVLSSGSLSVFGTQGALNSGTLLTGGLTNFGFSGDALGIVFEFTFDPNGGDLLSAYAGRSGGIVMSTSLNSFSGFGSSFDNLIISIPEPEAELLTLPRLFRNRVPPS